MRLPRRAAAVILILLCGAVPAVAGEDYVVDYRDDLFGVANWVELPGAPHNSGSVNDDSPFGTEEQRNYRVQIITLE